VIPEPQRTYVLELLKALGPAADDFVVAGAQAMKFVLEKARATKDIDFVLDVVGLRGEKVSIDARLKELGYKVVEGSRNFQFEKPIADIDRLGMLDASVLGEEVHPQTFNSLKRIREEDNTIIEEEEQFTESLQYRGGLSQSREAGMLAVQILQVTVYIFA
jgi:hypothetical protein